MPGFDPRGRHLGIGQPTLCDLSLHDAPLCIALRRIIEASNNLLRLAESPIPCSIANDLHQRIGTLSGYARVSPQRPGNIILLGLGLNEVRSDHPDDGRGLLLGTFLEALINTKSFLDVPALHISQSQLSKRIRGSQFADP